MSVLGWATYQAFSNQKGKPMNKNVSKRSAFDNSWAAWKDRLGVASVLVALLVLLFFMFTDASINFQCGVTDFILMKCNRFDREFKPWDQLDKKPTKSSYAPQTEPDGARVVPIGAKAYVAA